MNCALNFRRLVTIQNILIRNNKTGNLTFFKLVLPGLITFVNGCNSIFNVHSVLFNIRFFYHIRIAVRNHGLAHYLENRFSVFGNVPIIHLDQKFFCWARTA